MNAFSNDREALERLIARVRLRYPRGHMSEFHRAIGWTSANWYSKTHSKTQWSLTDIQRVCKVLRIPREEAFNYFWYDIKEKDNGVEST